MSNAAIHGEARSDARVVRLIAAIREEPKLSILRYRMRLGWTTAIMDTTLDRAERAGLIHRHGSGHRTVLFAPKTKRERRSVTPRKSNRKEVHTSTKGPKPNSARGALVKPRAPLRPPVHSLGIVPHGAKRLPATAVVCPGCGAKRYRVEREDGSVVVTPPCPSTCPGEEGVDPLVLEAVQRLAELEAEVQAQRAEVTRLRAATQLPRLVVLESGSSARPAPHSFPSPCPGCGADQRVVRRAGGRSAVVGDCRPGCTHARP